MEIEYDMVDDLYSIIREEDDFNTSEFSFRTSSTIENYFDRKPESVQISTVKLLDDIYDKYLAEVPDDLIQALKKAEDTKVHLISELFAQKIL